MYILLHSAASQLNKNKATKVQLWKMSVRMELIDSSSACSGVWNHLTNFIHDQFSGWKISFVVLQFQLKTFVMTNAKTCWDEFQSNVEKTFQIFSLISE